MTLPKFYTAYRDTPTSYDYEQQVFAKTVQMHVYSNSKANIAITIAGSTTGSLDPFIKLLTTPVTLTVYPVPPGFTGNENLKDDDPLPLGWGVTLAEYTFDLSPTSGSFTPDGWQFQLESGDIGEDYFIQNMTYYVVMVLGGENSIRSDLATPA